MRWLFVLLGLSGTALSARAPFYYQSYQSQPSYVYPPEPVAMPYKYKTDIYQYLNNPMAQVSLSPSPFKSMIYHHGGHDHDGDGQPDHPHTQHPGPGGQRHGGNHDHDGDGRPDHHPHQHTVIRHGDQDHVHDHDGLDHHHNYPNDGHDHHHGDNDHYHDHDNNGIQDHTHDQHPGQHVHYPGRHHQDIVSPAYDIVQQYPSYGVEERVYPSANWVCTRAEVDTGDDPMAGLERFNPVDLLFSRRYAESPPGVMFRLLQNYTSGQNSEGVQMERSQPVSVHHWVKKVLFGGNLEVQEMCFYLEHQYQEGETIPAPLDPSVYIFTRPEMSVYVGTFLGVAVTDEAWNREKEMLEASLAKLGKFHHDREYYSNCYSHPLYIPNRRSEVWLQKLDPSIPVIAAVEVDKDDINSFAPLPIPEAVVVDQQEEVQFPDDETKDEQQSGQEASPRIGQNKGKIPPVHPPPAESPPPSGRRK